MLEDGLHRPVVLHQLGGGLVADAGDTWNVVGRVTAQRFEVDELRRLEAIALANLVGSVHERIRDPATRHQRLDRFGDQLQAVEVPRDDRHRMAALLGDARQRADDVVGFEARDAVDGDRERFQDLTNLLDLRAQVVRHRAPPGLVLRVLLRSECRRREVERRHGELRARGQDDGEHGGEAVHRIGHLPVRRAHRRQGEKCPVDEAVGVDQNDAPALPLRHVWILRTPLAASRGR